MRVRIAVGLAGVAMVLLAGGAGRFYAAQAPAAGPHADGLLAVQSAGRSDPVSGKEGGEVRVNASGIATPGHDPRFRSDVAELIITPTEQLPAWRGLASDYPCRNQSPQSAEAEAVAGQGWLIMAEADAAGYRLVTFAGHAQSGTSMTCLRSDGGIALFRDGVLRALVQERRRPPPAVERDAIALFGMRPTLLGALEPLDQGGFRIFDGDYVGRAVADLQVAPDGSVSITPQAAVDTVCGGRLQLPNIHNMPINRARANLVDHGWVPTLRSSDNPPETAREVGFVKQGLPEVETCSGTGVGYCNFAYHKAGAVLTVTTAGEASNPPVVGYRMQCG